MATPAKKDNPEAQADALEDKRDEAPWRNADNFSGPKAAKYKPEDPVAPVAPVKPSMTPTEIATKNAVPSKMPDRGDFPDGLAGTLAHRRALQEYLRKTK